MHTIYDDDITVKVSKKWFMEVGWEVFNADPTDPKAIYYENKVKKMCDRLEYSKKFDCLDNKQTLA